MSAYAHPVASMYANVYADVHNTCLTYTLAQAWCSQHLFECATFPAKNTHASVHALLCNGAETSLPWKLLRTYLESCASIVQAVVCRPLLPPPPAVSTLLSRPSPDAVCSKKSFNFEFTIAHDAVAAAVLHKHHLIIRVGAGLIQFVYVSYTHLATGVTSSRILFGPFFRASCSNCVWTPFVFSYLVSHSD